MGVNTEGISCCFDDESERMLKDYRKDGLDDASMVVLDALSSRDLAGSSILELGCGIGALSLELLKKGAGSVHGMDLSPAMVELARSLAAEAGVSMKASFERGDGAVAGLPSSDVVILDKVLCCYPDVVALVANSSSAARRYYVFSLPNDKRVVTRFLRLFVPLQAIFSRRNSFRFFIHSTSQIEEKLKARGFTPVFESAVGWIWSVFIFAAPAAL
ncbi:MAG TPA: methyltransferase domain-containing protein [Nitrososphaerales archaeon]|nr:methyltransferase domain-containing protein [Nitrososphaerales archaeon]